MFQLIYLCIDMICPVLLLPPMLYLYGRYRKRACRHSIIMTLFALYVAAVCHLTGLPDILYYRKDITIYLGLFIGIFSDIKNSLLNVILFVPLGFFLPVLCDRFRKWQSVLLFGFLMSLSIELLQMFTLRTTDVNDLLTNCCGAVLGVLAADALLQRKPGFALRGSLADALIPLAAGFGIMYFIQPFLIYVIYDPIFR